MYIYFYIRVCYHNKIVILISICIYIFFRKIFRFSQNVRRKKMRKFLLLKMKSVNRRTGKRFLRFLMQFFFKIKQKKTKQHTVIISQYTVIYHIISCRRIIHHTTHHNTPTHSPHTPHTQHTILHTPHTPHHTHPTQVSDC